jgi:two-component system sensor histidine kinase HydH
VRKISNGVKGLNTLVSDMLAFTRDLSLRKQDVCLGDLVAATMELAAPSLLQHGIDAHLDDGLAAICVNVDAQLLERVLLNLILNAADAIGEKSAGKGKIAVRATKRGERIELTIEDNGPGIPADVIEHIFDPFFTTKHTGTGLGLAIVHRIVEAHGGTITAENRNPPERGARFKILI